MKKCWNFFKNVRGCVEIIAKSQEPQINLFRKGISILKCSVSQQVSLGALFVGHKAFIILLKNRILDTNVIKNLSATKNIQKQQNELIWTQLIVLKNLRDVWWAAKMLAVVFVGPPCFRGPEIYFAKFRNFFNTSSGIKCWN